MARFVAAAALWLAVLLPHAAHGAPDQQLQRQERLQRLPAFLDQATRDGGYLGAVVLVLQHRRVVQSSAHGHQDLARRLPMARDSIFRIYSMTKPIVTVAVLMLMEEGRLALDDPVARHLPEFAALTVLAGGTADAPLLRAPARPLTIRHLLTHTAGFATEPALSEVANSLLTRAAASDAADLKGFSARVAAAPLALDPGTRFVYDGVQTEVASRLVEVIAGMPFEQFVQQRIFTPLKMKDTGFEVPAPQRARIVDITTMADDGRLVRASGRLSDTRGVRLNAYASGAGGLYSTAADYARFCRMLLGGGSLEGQRLLGRKTVALMMSNQLGLLEPHAPPHMPGSPGEGFGLGGAVVTDPARYRRLSSLGQFGWSGAASTYFSIDREERLIAILLLQHLPRSELGDKDLPRLATPFYTLVYQALP